MVHNIKSHNSWW